MSVNASQEHIDEASVKEQEFFNSAVKQAQIEILVNRSIGLRAANLALQEEVDRLRQRISELEDPETQEETT